MLQGRSFRACALGCLAATVGWLAPAPAGAWPQDGEPVRARRSARAHPAPPVAERAPIVSGYLPRNHNVPMYNEPPRRAPAW